MFTTLTVGRRKWYSAGGGVLLVAAAAWGVTRHYVYVKDPAGLPPELSVASLQAHAEEPAQMWDTLRDTMNRTDLTDEQRREAMRRMREVREAELNKRMDEYFGASDAEKQAILDKQIDEMQKQREERAARREQAAESPDPNRTRDPNRVRDPNRPRRPDMGSMTPQERKTRAESRNPDRTAQRMTFFAALRARAEQRGIQVPFGPPGGPGGPGGRGGWGGRGGP